MSDEETLKAYAEKAQEYLKFISNDKPDRDLQRFIDAVPDGGRVLDLGCGPGNSAAMMQAAGLEAEAMDASQEMVEIAREKFGIDAKQASFADLDAKGLYDGIWANFSLLHADIADIPGHLRQIYSALVSGGWFHIGMKLGEGMHRDRLGRRYCYFSQDALSALLEETGFVIETLRAGELEGLAGTLDPFIIILARRHG